MALVAAGVVPVAYAAKAATEEMAVTQSATPVAVAVASPATAKMLTTPATPTPLVVLVARDIHLTSRALPSVMRAAAEVLRDLGDKAQGETAAVTLMPARVLAVVVEAAAWEPMLPAVTAAPVS